MAREIPEEQQRFELAFRKALAARIRALRAERDLNQDDCADLANLHRAHLGFIEQARSDPNLTTLLRIAGALGVSVSALLEVTVEDEQQDSPAG